MRLRRREFLKYSALGLVTAGLSSRSLLAAGPFGGPPPASLLRAQLLDSNFAFPYDDRNFSCAERIYNVRPAGAGVPGAKATLNLVPAPGKKLDLWIRTADTLEGLGTSTQFYKFNGVNDVLDVELAGSDAPRLYYQVLYSDGGAWQALFPKSVKMPTVSLEDGGEIKVIVFGDDHTFDDGDYAVPESLKGSKLSGDYVNAILRNIRYDPNTSTRTEADVLRNGQCLAHSLRYIMANEDPDLLINLGDTNGLGAGYKWAGLGLPTMGLTDKDHDDIARALWLRMRKMYSAVTPHVPVYIAQGNHDGEEQWNPVRARASEWRNRLFAMPTDRTFPEGGHPDGLYYAFSVGSDRSYRGGVRFIVLHTTAFTGDSYPKTPEGWTLGEAQRQWFERTVRLGGKHWVFACQHHALGGWPCGSNEQDKTMAYGRGPLFTREDYLPYAHPDLVEQVKLTDLGRENGLRAILYGHDHIFFSKKIGQTGPNADMLAVCCGSTKYMGEAGWWKDPYWSKDYGSSQGPSPGFSGPPGITRMTIRKDQVTIDYLHTAFSWYSNHPPEAGVGAILSTARLGNPPPRLLLETGEIKLEAAEGHKGPDPATLRIKNAGGGRMGFLVKAHTPWLHVFPETAESWGEWDEVKIYVRSSGLAAGDYTGRIIVTMEDDAGVSEEVVISLKVQATTDTSPIDLDGGQKRILRNLHLHH